MRARPPSDLGHRPWPVRAGDGRAWLMFDAGGELFRYQCHRTADPDGARVLPLHPRDARVAAPTFARIEQRRAA